ncbi:MAG: WD40 repeat domain-containing protein [Planctomycetaceae bacterium]
MVLWDPTKEQPERILRGHSGRILEVDWSPEGQQLVSSDDAGEIKIWDLTVPFSSPGFTIDSPVQALSWRDDNQTLVVVHESDQASSFWNALSGKKLSVMPPISEGQGLWSPDRQRVAYYEDGETAQIRVVNAERGEVHAIRLGVPGEKIAKLAWSPDGRLLAIGKFSDSEISVALWDVDREQSVSTWLHHGPWVEKIQLAWSPEATHVAITSLGETGDNGTPIWYGHVYVVNVAAGTTVLKHTMPHQADVSAVAWKPDSRAFVAGTIDGLIEAVDVESDGRCFLRNFIARG